MTLPFIEAPSPNHDRRRAHAPIDILLLHYTGMESAGAALERLIDAQAKVSCHYLIDEDGTLYRLVAEAHRAWHAGVSFWDGERDINSRSIGIELVNPGHEFGYRAFPEAQITTLKTLCLELLDRHRDITPARILGHSDVAPTRKQDPGVLFPWEELAKDGIGVWPETPLPTEVSAEHLLAVYGYETGFNPLSPMGEGSEDLASPLRASLDAAGEGLLQKSAPHPNPLPSGRGDMNITQASLIAFQRHFRPANIDGVAEAETIGLLAALCKQIES